MGEGVLVFSLSANGGYALREHFTNPAQAELWIEEKETYREEMSKLAESVYRRDEVRYWIVKAEEVLNG